MEADRDEPKGRESKAGANASSQREARLARALRDNLRRRKSAGRGADDDRSDR